MSDFDTPCIPSTQVEINGLVWTIYADTTAATIEKIELVSRALAKRGYKAPARASFGAGQRASKPLTQPLISDAGDPCCPIHKRRTGQPLPIRFYDSHDGRPGFWGCVAKSDGTPGETVNARGYCDLRFDWPSPAAAANGTVKR